MKKWQKKLSALLLASITLFGVVGCGNQDNSSKDNKGSKVSGSIVLYTSQPEADAQKLIEAFNQENPDVKVNVFRSGTEEVVSKVLAEQQANAVQADVLLVADAVTFEGLKDKNILEAYESKELTGIPSQFIDKDHMYTGTKVMTTGIMYNTSVVKTPITSFADLKKPEFKDQIIMPSPLYSGAAAYNTGVISRNSALGWPFFEALKANGVKVDKGNGAVQKAVISGNKGVGIIVDYMAVRAKKDGAPVEFIYPAEGAPTITEPIALLKASKNKEAAKAFIDFVLSEKGQKLAASIGYSPVKEGITPPEGLKGIKDIKTMEAAISELFKNREADKTKFTSIFQ